MIITKKEEDRYEVTTTKVVKDINDNDVEVVDRVSTYSLADLEAEKDRLQNDIDLATSKISEIDSTILAINNLE